MNFRQSVRSLAACTLFFISASLVMQAHSLSAQTGTTAEAVGQANLRATTSVESERMGEIQAGTSYPVIGRSELYPWYLLADPVTLQPIGWVFAELVTIQGPVNSVPFSNQVISASSGPALLPMTTATPAEAEAPAQPTEPEALANSPTPQPFTVAGTISGEVNIRYGPGLDFPRVGVGQAGDRFQVTGYHTQYPWLQIAYSGSPTGFAWIATDLLEVEGNVLSLPAISDGVLNLPTLTPTPSVLVSSARNNDEEITISPEFTRLGNQLWAYVLSAGFDPQTSRFGSLFIMNLDTGEALTFGNDFAFSGTSINKIAILARLYASLDEPPDGRLAIDIANTMICSENGATNRLLDVIGEGDQFLGSRRVTEMYQQLGLENSFLLAPFVEDPANPPIPPQPISMPQTSVDQRKSNPDFSNQITVEEMGYLLADIYECGYGAGGPLVEQFNGAIEPRECRQMLHVMANNNVDALLKAGVPETVRVAHKHGWIADTHGNAALFFTPGANYIIVMMLHQPVWLNYFESLPVIAEVSRQVYNFYNPGAPQPIVRDGFIPETDTCNFANTPLVVDLRQPIWDN